MNIIYRIKYRSFFNFLFFACCALFLTFVSCKKDVNTVIGKNAQPSGINAKFATDDSTASLYLTTYTVEDVPSVTSGRSSYALGSYYDETFGTLTANLITQLYDYNPSDSLNSIYGIDSVVLFLVYKDAYPFKEGNELKPITISIGELLEPVTIDSSSAAANYYSNEDRTQNSGSILSHKSVPLNYLLDSVVNPSDSTSKIVQPILRIRLDENNPNGTDYAWKLLTASQNASTINNFLTAIPGLYFESHPALSTKTSCKN